MPTPQEQFDELCFYTLAHGQPRFIHQHAVDAFAVQMADAHTKPIKVVFGLIGLYLYLEGGYTGKQVQLAHMQMAKRRKPWQKPTLPVERGDITVGDVLAAAPGAARDAAIHRWCVVVWAAYAGSHAEIARLARAELALPQ